MIFTASQRQTCSLNESNVIETWQGSAQLLVICRIVLKEASLYLFNYNGKIRWLSAAVPISTPLILLYVIYSVCLGIFTCIVLCFTWKHTVIGVFNEYSVTLHEELLVVSTWLQQAEDGFDLFLQYSFELPLVNFLQHCTSNRNVVMWPFYSTLMGKLLLKWLFLLLLTGRDSRVGSIWLD